MISTLHSPAALLPDMPPPAHHASHYASITAAAPIAPSCRPPLLRSSCPSCRSCRRPADWAAQPVVPSRRIDVPARRAAPPGRRLVRRGPWLTFERGEAIPRRRDSRSRSALPLPVAATSQSCSGGGAAAGPAVAAGDRSEHLIRDLRRRPRRDGRAGGGRREVGSGPRYRAFRLEPPRASRIRSSFRSRAPSRSSAGGPAGDCASTPIPAVTTIAEAKPRTSPLNLAMSMALRTPWVRVATEVEAASAREAPAATRTSRPRSSSPPARAESARRGLRGPARR